MLVAAILAASTICPALEKNSSIVRTVAGGIAGISDSIGRGARFLTPTGLAIDQHGRIVISDASGQRIKSMDRTGNVRTIAGSGPIDESGFYVEGGYQNGPALQAKFHNPNGVAVAGNGDIYVADTDNDAVRLIHNGYVSTVVGGPAKRGPDIGTAATVTATRVMAVAADADGNVYFGNERGLRVLQPTGKVIRLTDEIAAVYSVSVYGSGPSRSIFAVTNKGVEYFGPRGSQRVLRGNAALVDGQSNIAADDLIGSPIGIAAVNDREAAVTDAATGTVYILDARQGRIDYIVGSAIQSHSGDEALERDGAASEARFNEPWGVAYNPVTRAIVVADAGSARIRQISGFGIRGPHDGASVGEAAQAEPPTVRVALVGNSFAYFHTNYGDSIEGVLERNLTSRAGRCVMVDAIGIGSDLNAYRSFLSVYGSIYDITILQLNGTHIEETFGPKPGKNYPFDYDSAALAAAAPSWGPKLTRFLSEANATVKAQGHKLLVVEHPYPQDVSSNEMLWNRFVVEYGAGMLRPQREFYSTFDGAIRASKMPMLDLWPKFEAAESQKACALFGTQNVHFSRCGRRLVADGITDALLTRKWIP